GPTPATRCSASTRGEEIRSGPRRKIESVPGSSAAEVWGGSVKPRIAWGQASRRIRLDQRGISLIESVVALVIVVITVVGLAHLFGSGRAIINHYEVARAAYAAAQQRLELLTRTATSSDLSVGAHPDTLNPFAYQGVRVGSEGWTVTWYDDPVDGQGGADTNPNDLKLVTVTVSWGNGFEADTVRV